MMSDLIKASSRLKWRFRKEQGNFKHFTPNEKDVEALNCILNWINNQKKDTLNNNQLFAKLFIYQLTMNIRYFGTTVLDPIPQKDLSRILNTPLINFYKAFENDLYNNQLNTLLEKDVDQDRVLKDYIEQKNLYPSELITGQLNHMITEALNRFN